MNRTLHPRTLMNPLFAMFVSVVFVLQLSTGGMTNGLASRIVSANFLAKIEAELVAIERTEHANDLKLNSLSLSNWGGSAGRQSEFAINAVLPLVGALGAVKGVTAAGKVPKGGAGGTNIRDVNVTAANNAHELPPYNPNMPVKDFHADGTTTYFRVLYRRHDRAGWQLDDGC